ncbi:MAG: ribonuclease H-like domain-containing protein [Chloroflexi bacterium]|nr:ribonuclease H-like domain-containing protein [Chloroflexota bacterium]MBP8054825.1 ribonuclease H-like domain-containing protein [Chloroflexota bacterium]
MAGDWQKRLRELGVVKGVRDLKPVAPIAPVSPPLPLVTQADLGAELDEPQPVERLLPGGKVVSTTAGACFVLDHVYPLTHWHGDERLGDLLEMSPAAAATFALDPRFAQLHFQDCLFLDTETTGLWGAGTLAFMVGAAFFEGRAFIVRQYFLRDHGDETAMLYLLNELIASKTVLVTFNGRGFDLPLLDNRFLMNRQETALLEKPHLDLLPPSRRLWRNRIGSCALSSLEKSVLSVRRTQEDVPGYLIPGLYLDYLRQGDARELLRVFYHNQIDMLSMVTLLQRVLRQWSRPRDNDPPQDLLSLGLWQMHIGLSTEAEATFRLAAAQDIPLELYHQILHHLATLLKQQERRAEAANIWMQIAATSFDDFTAHIELAKYFEWQEQDVAPALHWTRQALELLLLQPLPDPTLHHQLQHRLTRLERKYQQAHRS